MRLLRISITHNVKKEVTNRMSPFRIKSGVLVSRVSSPQEKSVGALYNSFLSGKGALMMEGFILCLLRRLRAI